MGPGRVLKTSVRVERVRDVKEAGSSVRVGAYRFDVYGIGKGQIHTSHLCTGLWALVMSASRTLRPAANENPGFMRSRVYVLLTGRPDRARLGRPGQPGQAGPGQAGPGQARLCQVHEWINGTSPHRMRK